jgi:hypothetical protein
MSKPGNQRMLRFASPLVLATTLVWGCGGDEPQEAPDATIPADAGLEAQVQVIEDFDVESFNQDLEDDVPTADLAFYLTESGPLTWEDLKGNVDRAKRIFAAVGVQLRVRSAVRISVPPDWQRLDPADIDLPQTPPELRERDLYRHLEGIASTPTLRTEAILEAIVAHMPSDTLDVPAHRTVHLISLQEVPIPFYEWDGAAWVYDSVPTGGLSLPSYIYEERMPQDLRGVITLSFEIDRFQPETRVLSHELGHKLINVSHEGREVCPSFEANGPELMLYGNGEDIPAGPVGRYHQERLVLSPFLYTVEAGSPVFANEYQDGGGYRDSIYGDLIVDPPCPE